MPEISPVSTAGTDKSDRNRPRLDEMRESWRPRVGLSLIDAMSARWSRSVWYGLGGALYAIAGLFVVIYPIEGARALTVAFLIITDGILRVAFATAIRSVVGWGCFVAAGIGSGAVGVILLAGWPATAVWAIGLLLGLSLVFIGATHAALAPTVRADTPTARTQKEIQ